MAVQGFKGLGWFLCGVIVAPACYMVTSHGAAERARLKSVQAAIVQAQRDIRGLETEFNTRANLAQIERWNGDVLAMAAPEAQQYLASETALASLDRMDGQATVQTAALVVPAGVSPVQAVAAEVASNADPVQAKAAGKSVAQQDSELRNLMKKADRKAVAMVDRGVLSASTIDDLEKLAKREKLALR
ncbi:hypothetical protein [Sphingomonas sp. dw_22]|uniref:hypothetical protein n=1 Tax=Sphingomonas sp. dw_22 TaxID=2721175 RepID=UPI00211687FB|nr:hypothetical protein [Sphingomonas sp. dw_22]